MRPITTSSSQTPTSSSSQTPASSSSQTPTGAPRQPDRAASTPDPTTSPAKRTRVPYTVEEIRRTESVLVDPFTGRWAVKGDPDNPAPSYRGTVPLTVTAEELRLVVFRILKLAWGCGVVRQMRDARHLGGSCKGRCPFVIRDAKPPVSTRADTYEPDLDDMNDPDDTSTDGTDTYEPDLDDMDNMDNLNDMDDPDDMDGTDTASTIDSTTPAGQGPFFDPTLDPIYESALETVTNPGPGCEDCAEMLWEIVCGVAEEDRLFKGVLAVMVREACDHGPRRLDEGEIRHRIINVAKDYERAEVSRGGGLARPKEAVAELQERIGLDDECAVILVDILFGIRFNNPLEDDVPMGYVIDQEVQRHHVSQREARHLVLGVVATVKERLAGLRGRDRTWWERNVTRPANASIVATPISLSAPVSADANSASLGDLQEDRLELGTVDRMESEVMTLLGSDIRSRFEARYLTVGGGRTAVLWDVITEYFTERAGQSPAGLGGQRLDPDLAVRARGDAELAKVVRDIARGWERTLLAGLRRDLLVEVLRTLPPALRAGHPLAPLREGHRTDTLKDLLDQLPQDLYAHVAEALRTDLRREGRADGAVRLLRGVRRELRVEVKRELLKTVEGRVRKSLRRG